MREYKVEVPYIGGVLSKNSYKFKNRGTKPVVKQWMKELEEKVREADIEGLSIPFEVGVFGYFWDGKRPDLHNLFDTVADAVKKGLGVDDRYFRMVADGWEEGHKEQKLVITVRTN